MSQAASAGNRNSWAGLPYQARQNLAAVHEFAARPVVMIRQWPRASSGTHQQDRATAEPATPTIDRAKRAATPSLAAA
jgi:hypothetical protein